MAEIINMPRLSDTMEEGTVASWLKNVGDTVSEGDILAEIETDKATMEFESFYEGTLLHIGIQEGETTPVDKLLCIIGEEGEDISALLNGSSADSNKSDETASSQSATSSEKTEQTAEAGSGTTTIPEGVEVINMPRLSDTMEEGTVASWLKKEGDTVEEGDILAEIETDKATMEFESFYSGTLLYIGIEEGNTAPVDSLLAIIGPEGTDISGLKDGGTGKSTKTSGENKDDSTSAADATATITAAANTTASGYAAEPKKEAEKENLTNTKGQASSTTHGRIFISPLAKKIASEKGYDISQIKGTGENGRIIKKDVEAFTPAAAPSKSETNTAVNKGTASAPVQLYTPTGEVQFEEVKNSQMRKAIARSLSKSKFSAPHYYLTLEVDMEIAMASRKQINEMPDVKVSFNDMVVKASAMALRKHPKVNTQWTDDSIKVAKHISIGVAVAVPDGLLVPVLPFADQMSLTQIGQNVRSLAGKAKDKKLSPSEMEGSTFTVSNLGMFGITSFTSIINQPNSAILSVGAIVEKPVVKNGMLAVGHTMTVTLACDHRTVDGATGAAFLQTLKTYLENPVTMLA